MSDKLNDDIVIEGSAVQDNSYNIEESNSLGKVQIADDVVAIIAGLAAGEVEGVYRLTGNLPNGCHIACIYCKSAAHLSGMSVYVRYPDCLPDDIYIYRKS